MKAVRNATLAHPTSVAFLWSPNDGSGYPYSGYGIVSLPTAASNPTDFAALDTNKDGVINNQDDPYTPYYPGDQYVDWVGMSIYHYSNTYPYGANDVTPQS